MFTISQLDEHLIGMGHMGTLNKIRNKEAMYERAASKLLLKAKPVETIRLAALSTGVWDNYQNYALPSDFNSLIDLMPQDDRQQWDQAFRRPSGEFDREKAMKNRTISIEGRDGSKIIRINWKSRQAKVLSTMESATPWSAVGSAANIEADNIFKISGAASIRFDVVASGDGIKATTLDSLDLTDEDEVADCFVDIYLPVVPTSIQLVWGNDLTTKYWTGVAQTAQADGTAFKVGWNKIRTPWSTATETGTVDPTSIDSFQAILNTGTVPMNNVRIDNVVFAIGRNFDIKYYSKYLFKTAAGTYESRPSTDDSYVTIDNDSLPLFLYELLQDMAHQVEGSDSTFDIEFAKGQLMELYPAFRSEHSDQRVKSASRYGQGPQFRRR